MNDWATLKWHYRVTIFRKAADLLSQKEGDASSRLTMKNLSKNPFEAENNIVELIDFFYFNVYFFSNIFSPYSESLSTHKPG